MNLRQANSKPVFVPHDNHGDGHGPSPSRSRNYAQQLQKAHQLATSLFVREILEEEKRLAYEYDNEKANQAIILFNRETNQVLRLPYYMRFKKEYAEAIKKKIWGVIYPQVAKYRNFLFATFNASTTRYYSQEDAHRKIQKHWNSLLTRIRKKYPWIKIIKSCEWQENGIGYHIHVLFCGVRFIPIDWIRETWNKLEPNPRSVDLDNKFRIFDNPKRALGYLMKYVTKTLRKGDEIPMSLVVNWALRLRTISLSRRFSSHKNNSNDFSNSDWVFLGVMPIDLAQSYSDYEILSYFEYG